MPRWDGSKGSIEALHRYWNSRAGGLAPQRNDIEPADIKPLLPFLYIVRYEREPFRVRYILTGTEADRWNGFSLTGRYVDEFLATDIHGANRILLDAYTKAFETTTPVFGTYTWPPALAIPSTSASACSPCALASTFNNALPSRIIRASRRRWPTTASPLRG